MMIQENQRKYLLHSAMVTQSEVPFHINNTGSTVLFFSQPPIIPTPTAPFRYKILVQFLISSLIPPVNIIPDPRVYRCSPLYIYNTVFVYGHINITLYNLVPRLFPQRKREEPTYEIRHFDLRSPKHLYIIKGG